MKHPWPIKKLHQLADQITDGTHNSPPYVEAGIPMLDSKHVKDGFVIDDTEPEKFISPSTDALLGMRCKPRTGDILISSRGSIGKIAIVTDGQDFNIMGNMILIRLPETISRKFAALYLHSQVTHLESIARGVAQKGLYLNQVRNFDLPLPPLYEQQQIVGILDEAFESIVTAKANTEKNLQNARAIFESHLHSVFIQRPKGWVETSIGDVCTLKSGTTVPIAIERSDGDIPYLKVAEMTMPANSEGVTTSIRFLNQTDIKPAWIIPAGAVIFPKRGGAILTNKKRLALVDMCADLNIMSVIPTDKLTPEFLYMYFLTVDMRKLGTGSSIPQINNYDIAPLPISFPQSKTKQIEVTEALRTVKMECEVLAATYERKVAALEALKKSLLHLAFAGQL